MLISSFVAATAAAPSPVDSTVLAAVATGFFAVIGTYITVRYKDRIITKADKPKDRMETIFDGYENLIKQQQTEISRKGLVITSLEGVVQRLEDELKTTRELLVVARDELKTAEQQNRDLTVQLREMKESYAKTGHP